MKRILALILALVMCVGMFASCDNGGNKDNGYDVEGAASFLYNIMKDGIGKETPRSFDVTDKVTRAAVTYTVEWVSDNEKVVIADSNKEGYKTVQLPTENDTAFDYKLTATVKDPDGNTAVKEFSYIMPVVTQVVGITTTPVPGTAYKLFVNQLALERRIYALTEIKSGKFTTSNDAKKAADFFVEEAEGGYYIYTMDGNAKKYLSTAKVPNNSTPGAFYDNPALTDDAQTVWYYISEFNVWCAMLEGSEFGLGAYSSNESIGISGSSYFKDEDTKDGQYSCQFITKAYAETLTPDVGVQNPDGPENGSTLTIAEANELGAGFLHDTYSTNKYYIVGEITSVYNDSYGNMYVKDDQGNSITIYGTYISDLKYGDYKGTNKPVAGDTVKLYGKIGQYGGTPQMKNADIVEINGVAVGGSSSGGSTGGTIPTPDSNLADLVNQIYALGTDESITGTFVVEGVITELSNDGYNNPTVVIAGLTDKPIFCYKLKDSSFAVGQTIIFTATTAKNYMGTTYEFMNCTLHAINGVAVGGGSTGGSSSAGANSIEAIAAALGWADSQAYTTFTLDGATVSAIGTPTGSYGLNTGKYYTNGQSWRIYQNEGGQFTITAPDGKTIASVKITWSTNSTADRKGALELNGEIVESGTTVTVNASSITFGVLPAAGTENTKGQVWVQGIEIVYAE